MKKSDSDNRHSLGQGRRDRYMPRVRLLIGKATIRNMRPVIVPCVNICIAAPVSPTGDHCPATPATDDIPTSTYPMW